MATHIEPVLAMHSAIPRVFKKAPDVIGNRDVEQDRNFCSLEKEIVVGNALAREVDHDSLLMEDYAGTPLGGYVCVSIGLILEAFTETELAGATAHEIAHVAARCGTCQEPMGA